MSRALEKRPNHDHEEKKPIPRWLPLSLLTVTTIALAVPATLLWRQKRALSQNQLVRTGAPPARRRGGEAFRAEVRRPEALASAHSVQSPPPRRAGASSISKPSLSVRGASPAAQEPRSAAFPQNSSEGSASFTDGPLMSLGALVAATGLVGFVAAVGIWGVQRTLGVDNVDDFAKRVRQLIRTHMPVLSSRLHRPTADSNSAECSTVEGPGAPENEVDKEEWTWNAAEDRLSAAYDRGGVGEWAARAIFELEAEEKLERKRRGL